MSSEKDNHLLDTALGLMDAAVPGMFDDPRAAWMAYVPRLRFVVIARSDSLSVDQLKLVQTFADMFVDCTARNLLEFRKALSLGDLRLKAVPLEYAEANLELLRSHGIGAHLAQLSEEEKCERLRILDDLPPQDET